jgi:hypothetical protein
VTVHDLRASLSTGKTKVCSLSSRADNMIFAQYEIDKIYNADTDKITYWFGQGEYAKDERQHFQIYAQFKNQIDKEIKRHLMTIARMCAFCSQHVVYTLVSTHTGEK